MFIVPLTSSITPMETMSQKKQTESTDDGEATFFDVFESLVKNVKETDAQVQKDSVDLMLGDVDDLAQIQVNLEKAATAVDLLVTVKNKAVDAYNEIRQLEKNGYSVDKITAAVTVDQINMLEADKEQLREVIAFAIGADVANVTVANYPFVINGNNGTNGNGNTINRAGSVDWTVYIILLLGLLVLALLIVAILTSNAKKKKRAKARAKAAAAQAAAAQAAQESAALSFEPQPQPDEEFNIQHLDEYDDESKSAVLKKEIKDFSRTNPDVVAQLIRSMMKNGE